MAGGIFTGKPFELNIKCVIISIIGILLFLLPGFQIYEEGNIWSMIIIIMLLFIKFTNSNQFQYNNIIQANA